MQARGGTADEMVIVRCRAGGRSGQPQKRRKPKGVCSKKVMETFLRVLADTCNVREAARAIGKCASTVYRWRQKDAAFFKAWAAALEQGFDALEMELLRRARFGQDVTEYRIGEDGIERPVKRVHSYCNRLGLQLLAQHRKAVAEYRAQQGQQRSDGSWVMDELKRRLGIRKDGAEPPVPPAAGTGQSAAGQGAGG